MIATMTPIRRRGCVGPRRYVMMMGRARVDVVAGGGEGEEDGPCQVEHADRVA